MNLRDHPLVEGIAHFGARHGDPADARLGFYFNGLVIAQIEPQLKSNH
jgi:hypothetical protein